MEHESVESGFTPGAGSPTTPVKAPRPLVRVLRWPAALTAAGVVAAICLHGGPVAQAANARPLGQVSSTFTGRADGQTVHVVGATALQRSYVAMAPVDGTTTSGGGASEPSPGGGIRGGFSYYEGAGGGIEFWFDPNTGQLTVAIGVGVGVGGEGVLGTYSPGAAPEPGVYDYVNASFAAGTVTTVNVSGEYSWSNGKFAGTVGTTVQGRTLTISSDGTSSFTVNTSAEEGAEGFTGAVGVKGVFSFNIVDVISKIWNAIVDDIWGAFDLDDDDYYDFPIDDDDDDTTATTTDDDDTIGGDDDGYGDDGSGDDGGDGGGGGGGGGCDDVYEAASFLHPAHAPALASHTAVGVPASSVTPLLEAPVEPCGDDDDGEFDDE